MLNKFKNDTTLESLFVSMLRLRMVEERIAEIYKEQIIRTPAHLGIGQEAVAVGVCSVLNSSDVVYSHHRCHNHYLAQGGNLYSLIAELLGKEDGCSNGRGGSVHITDKEAGFIVSSAILGQTVAVATGSALAFKMDQKPNIAVSFFGDAVLEEGVFWESINYASIHNLPVLFVCENNLYSTESHAKIRQPRETTLSDRVRSFNINAKIVNGNDVQEVFNAAECAQDMCRAGKGPYFLECNTYRWLEHVGPYFDHELNRTYRSKKEVDSWIAKDPIKLAERILLEDKSIDETFIITAKKEIRDEINIAVDRGRLAAWPNPVDLSLNVY